MIDFSWRLFRVKWKFKLWKSQHFENANMLLIFSGGNNIKVVLKFTCFVQKIGGQREDF